MLLKTNEPYRVSPNLIIKTQHYKKLMVLMLKILQIFHCKINDLQGKKKARYQRAFACFRVLSR